MDERTGRDPPRLPSVWRRFPSVLRLAVAVLLLGIGSWLLVRPPAERKNPPAPPHMAGIWAGGFELTDGWTYVEVRFPTGVSYATIDQPLQNQREDVVSEIRADASHLHFELPKSVTPLVFDGERQGGTITGEVRQAEDRGPFQLVQLRQIPKFEEVAGTYDLGAGRLIGIGISRIAPPAGSLPFAGGLSYQDFSSGRTGFLFPVGNDTMALGPGMLIPLPVEIEVKVVRNAAGAVTGLRLRESGRPEAAAARLVFRDEAVRFENREVSIFGTLTLPDTAGPHPALVFVAAPSSRYAFGELAHLFARRGIAVLTTDTRGLVTDSGRGTVFGATPDDLAQDVLAGVRFLKSRREIDAKRVGLWGTTDGGALALAAAARSPEVAFVALLASPAVPFWEVERDRMEHELRADGFPASDIAEVLSLTRLQEEAQRAGRGNPQLDAAYESGRQRKWWPYIFNFRATASYDPVPALENVRAPLLAVFGELDQTVLAEKNGERMRVALRRAGNTHYTVVIVPRANHDFLVAQTGGRKEWPRLSRMAPGYLDTTIDWILARAAAAR